MMRWLERFLKPDLNRDEMHFVRATVHGLVVVPGMTLEQWMAGAQHARSMPPNRPRGGPAPLPWQPPEATESPRLVANKTRMPSMEGPDTAPLDMAAIDRACGQLTQTALGHLPPGATVESVRAHLYDALLYGLAAENAVLLYAQKCDYPATQGLPQVDAADVASRIVASVFAAVERYQAAQMDDLRERDGGGRQ